MTMNLESMAVDFPRLASHPNRAPFRGVLTLVDTPSDRAPAGAGGHRVLLARDAVERALPSLLGMGLDYAPSLDRHDAQRKVGIITEADVERGQWPAVSAQSRAGRGPLPTGHLLVGGFLYARDFPQLMRELRAQRSSWGTAAPGCDAVLSSFTQPRAAGLHAAGLHAAGPHALGMSYEIADARVEDLNAAIWRVVDFTFTGAAILRRDKAAYRQTWIELT